MEKEKIPQPKPTVEAKKQLADKVKAVQSGKVIKK
jgi:hypothetical protein